MIEGIMKQKEKKVWQRPELSRLGIAKTLGGWEAAKDGEQPGDQAAS